MKHCCRDREGEDGDEVGFCDFDDLVAKLVRGFEIVCASESCVLRVLFGVQVTKMEGGDGKQAGKKEGVLDRKFGEFVLPDGVEVIDQWEATCCDEDVVREQF